MSHQKMCQDYSTNGKMFPRKPHNIINFIHKPIVTSPINIPKHTLKMSIWGSVK